MTIRTRLVLAFGLLCLLIVGQFGVSYFTTNKTQGGVAELVKDHEISRILAGVSSSAQEIRRYEKEYFIYINNSAKRNGYWNEWQEAATKIKTQLTELDTLLANTPLHPIATLLPEWNSSLAYYVDGFTGINKQVLNGKITTTLEANSAVQNAKNQFRVLVNGSKEEVISTYESSQQRALAVSENVSSVQTLFLVVTVVCLILGVIATVFIPRAITSPILKLTEITSVMSKGKVDQKVDISGSPEIIELSKSVERMRLSTMGLLQRYKTQKQRADRATEAFNIMKKRALDAKAKA